ncbi:MAG: DUF308 domain-containing protein [Erysipelotrichaceae bacterium]|nr:DUF308 domain-containing protein [Erysipelotrichaceae bacterium]
MNRKESFNWMEFMAGVICVIVGIYTLSHPKAALSSFAVVYGIMAVINGISDMAFYMQLERSTGFGPMLSMISGIVNIMLGIVLIMFNNITVRMMSIIFPVWFIIHCLGRMLNLNFIKLTEGNKQFYISMAVCIAGIVIGVAMLFHPFGTEKLIGALAGIYLLLVGIGKLLMVFGQKEG